MRFKCVALVLSALLLFAPTAKAIDRTVDGFPDLPKDARAVAERQLGCLHFSGEFGGTRSERDRQVVRELKRLRCNHIERDLGRIKAKYRNNPTVLKIMQEAIDYDNY